MPDILRLPPNVINKIAAGEVIERPASVVKELVENSLDAGATRVDVVVEKGGVELLRVSDNGCGIAPQQLALAVEAHATSKIRNAEDLFRVATLGFRGEALASIAAVSRFSIRSRVPGSEAGAELELIGGGVVGGESFADEPVVGGEVVGGDSSRRPGVAADANRPLERPPTVAPCGCPVGTTVEVQNLFFNTPVRRKFLKSTQTEMGHVNEVITRLALAHPQVHFTLRHNGREVYDLPPTHNWVERIARFFGQELAAALVPIERSEPDCRLFGYVAQPSQSRPNNRTQYFFLNGRYIRDRSLQHALSEAYRGLLLTGRFPVAFLCLELPPEAVDVNVHPTKLEVRFQDSGRMYSLLLGTLRMKFLTTDLTAKWKPPGAAIGDGAAHDAGEAEAVRNELVAWAKGQMAAWEEDEKEEAGGRRQEAAGSGEGSGFRVQGSGDPASGGRQPPDDVAAEDARRWEAGGRRQTAGDRNQESGVSSSSATRRDVSPLRLNRLDRPWPPSVPGSHVPETGDIRDRASAPMTGEPLRPTDEGTAPHALQVHNRYLIAETAEGVLVIDQHALHERILYEQLREKVLAGALESQSLLVPEPVDLSPAEAAAVLDNAELLAQLGVNVQPFGGETVLVTSYPAMLAQVNLVDMLRGIIERLLAGGKEPERRDVLDELLHMMSCKAAVKAGDPLTAEEIEALLRQRHLAHDTHHCPHGRPTALVLTREDLDRQFLRT
jgi:DNA mismatch repair protein MutL